MSMLSLTYWDSSCSCMTYWMHTEHMWTQDSDFYSAWEMESGADECGNMWQHSTSIVSFEKSKRRTLNDRDQKWSKIYILLINSWLKSIVDHIEFLVIHSFCTLYPLVFCPVLWFSQTGLMWNNDVPKMTHRYLCGSTKTKYMYGKPKSCACAYSTWVL